MTLQSQIGQGKVKAMEIYNMDYYAFCCQERALYASLPGSNNSAPPIPRIDFNLTGSSLSESAATPCQCYQGNQTSNETVPDLSLPSYLFVYVTVASAIIFPAGVFGNLLVMFVVVRMRSMRTRMNYFLVSLSVADLMVLMVCQPVALLELYARERWLLGAAMCKVIPFLENTAIHCSALSLLAISMERYVAICRPLLATRRRHSRWSAIAVTWLVSIALCVPFIFITSIDQVVFYDDSVVLVCRTSSNTPMSRVFFLVDFILCLVLPLLAITFFYCAIVFTLTPRYCCRSRSKADTFNIHSTTHPDSRAISRRQVIRMMVAVVAVFYICLLPFRCLAIVTVFGSPEQLERLGFTGYTMLVQTSRLLTFVNSASNPVIYGLMCSKFRKAFATALPFSCWRREARTPHSSCKQSTYAGVSTRLYQLRSTKRGRLKSTSDQENGEAESIRSGGLVQEGPDEDDKYTSEDVGGQVGRARTDYFGD